MATAKKRSLSNMQHSDSNPPTSHGQNDNDTYRMMVLRMEEPEEEVDRHFLQKALELGINIPQDPKTTLDLITHDVTALDLSPATSESPESPFPSPSRTSHSTHSASGSSIESHHHRKTPSLAATSITSAPSTTSVASHKSNYVKFKKGFRRISAIRRRKTLTAPAPELPVRPSPTHLERPELHPHPSTADRINQVAMISHSDPHAMTTELPPMNRPTARQKVMSVPQTAPPPPPPLQPLQGPPPPPSSSPNPPSTPSERLPTPRSTASTDPAGVDRSLADPNLKKLRTMQLQEQLRFISFRASQTRLMRTKHLQLKRDSLAAYKAAQTETESHHAEAFSNVEQQHLAAEVDLLKTLETEKQACEVRLKHMQAYCNPREHIEGMPKRIITKSDYKKLEQQYHVKNGMENLHASRINVLREKQAKHLERVLGKQEDDISKLSKDFEKGNLDLDQRFTAQERNLNQEFAERKQRLISRWHMAEAIERRKLELETGEEYAPLPGIEWGHQGRDGADEEEEEMKRIIASRGISVDPETGIMVMEGGEIGEVDDVGEHKGGEGGGGGRYDSLNMI
ncbi:MAG: hypothetical protein Q9164_000864 [Protoblastenia rupestris]